MVIIIVIIIIFFSIIVVCAQVNSQWEAPTAAQSSLPLPHPNLDSTFVVVIIMVIIVIITIIFLFSIAIMCSQVNSQWEAPTAAQSPLTLPHPNLDSLPAQDPPPPPLLPPMGVGPAPPHRTGRGDSPTICLHTAMSARWVRPVDTFGSYSGGGSSSSCSKSSGSMVVLVVAYYLRSMKNKWTFVLSRQLATSKIFVKTKQLEPGLCQFISIQSFEWSYGGEGVGSEGQRWSPPQHLCVCVHSMLKRYLCPTCQWMWWAVSMLSIGGGGERVV